MKVSSLFAAIFFIYVIGPARSWIHIGAHVVIRSGQLVGVRQMAVVTDVENGPASKSKMSREAQELEEILALKKQDPTKAPLLIAQTAPSVRVTISEEFGEIPGAFSGGVLAASLKELGFDLVLDTNTAADLTVCEEGAELLHRIRKRQEKQDTGEISNDDPQPLFTSCCPGWMFYVEKSEKSLIPYVLHSFRVRDFCEI
jgi:iron only hydrogenase large subunit-like protein